MYFFLPILIVGSSAVFGYETDQYTNRTQKVADSLVVMNQQVNEALDRIIDRRHQPASDRAFSRAMYHEVGGLYWADKIERWAAKAPEVDKYRQTRYESVYRGMPIWATRVNFVFGIGRSFRVNDVMVGSDKFGHFFSQGYKYARREFRGESKDMILAKGRFAERWIFGQLTTGAYSNADLVANYEGWRFYQSLFRDGVVSGKRSILLKENGRYIRQRDFTWADHINDYWDEALNPSYLVRSLNRRLRERIHLLCDEYRGAPEYFESENDDVLWAQYQHLGLKDNRANQFRSICAE